MSFSCPPVSLYVCVDMGACGNVHFIRLYMSVLNHITIQTHQNIQYINIELLNKDDLEKNREQERLSELLYVLCWQSWQSSLSFYQSYAHEGPLYSLLVPWLFDSDKDAHCAEALVLIPNKKRLKGTGLCSSFLLGSLLMDWVLQRSTRTVRS